MVARVANGSLDSDALEESVPYSLSTRSPSSSALAWAAITGPPVGVAAEFYDPGDAAAVAWRGVTHTTTEHAVAFLVARPARQESGGPCRSCA